MENLKDYGFEKHPFPLMPEQRVINWAGMKDVRRRLEDVVESVLSTDTGLSEFIVIHGTYGAGKSHALRYLTTLINEVEKTHFQSLAIYMSKSRVASKFSFFELYKHIIREIGHEKLRHFASAIKHNIDTAVKKLRSQHKGDVVGEILEQDPLHFEKEVVSSLPSNDQSMVRLLLELSKGHNEVLDYLTNGKPIVQSSDYTQEIKSDYVATQVLSDLFRTLTLQIGDREPVCRGIHLFIDEVEDLFEAKATEQNDMFQSFRELVNRLPYNFALILSFSADTALLEAFMPNALAERLSRRYVEFQSLEVPEAKEFIKEQLEAFRPDEFEVPQPFHPFTEDTIDYVLEQNVILIPRRIFRDLRLVLDRAIRREGLKPGEEIDGELAEEILLAVS
ncbi:hypothetical protein MJD09_00770 [bacterium]|nr:hypothetical protein [bacterium]